MDVGVGSSPTSATINLPPTPLRLNDLCGLLVGGLKLALLKVSGLRTSSISIMWECVRNADSQCAPDLLN